MKMDTTFDPQTLADDLEEVERIYARFFSALDDASWDRPVKRGAHEWTLHESVAHLCALNGDGLESLKRRLHDEPYTFRGLESRYEFNAFNRRGIDERLALPKKDLCTRLLEILDKAARTARDLGPVGAGLTAPMPIYNRPITVVEGLSIIMIHTGVFHSAQVAEPAGQPPLWTELSPEVRHRAIGRTMRAFSLLYRHDIGGPLRTTFVFRVAGPGGGEWHLDVAPEAVTSGEGVVAHPGLVIHMRDTDVFCRMLTSRLNLPMSLISGALGLHGDLRLFLRMNTLLSVDARPPDPAQKPSRAASVAQTGD
jgi:Mycothiol maleylpyruvate isomerase N-terminal domain/SCP-2 sterol transfer family